jgi:hypothetical protein
MKIPLQAKTPAGPGLALTTTAFADGAVIAVSPMHDPDAPLQRKAARAELLKAMDGHILGKGVMVGWFHR